MSLLLLVLSSALGAPPTTPEELALQAVSAPPGVELVVAHTTPFAGGPRVRLAQQVGRLPVHGGDVVVALAPDGSVRRIKGRLLSSIPDRTPTITADEAIARAEAITDGTGSLWPARSELVVLAEGGRGRLAWRVDVSRRAPLAAWQVLVDARSGTIVRREQTLHTARGNIYLTNPAVSALVETELPGATDGQLQSDLAVVVSCDTWDNRSGCTEFSAHATPDLDGNYLFEPDATSSEDPFSEVQMYYHLDLVGQFFSDLGFDHAPLSGMRPMVGYVNFDYDNAFFGDADGDGSGEVAFGQGSGIDFAYDADVVYHEFSHSVYEAVVRPTYSEADEYGYEGAGLGINEGTADLFSMVITGDPLLGEYAGTGFGLGGAVRDLEPDRRCPDGVYGESHEDGMIWASLGWNLIDDERIGVEVTGQLVLGAISLFPSNVNWEEAGESLVESADDLLAASAIDATTHDAILELGQASGVVGCGRVVRLDEGATSTQWMRGRAGRVMPGYTQFSLDAPEGTQKLVFRIDEIDASGPELEANIYVRRGDHIVHDMEEVTVGNGYTFEVPTPAVYDYVVEGVPGGFELVVDTTSEMPLVPGATYFFSITSHVDEGVEGFFGGEITVSGESEVVEPIAEDPIRDEDEEIRACGCSAAGATPWTAWLLLPLLALRRRNRVA